MNQPRKIKGWLVRKKRNGQPTGVNYSLLLFGAGVGRKGIGANVRSFISVTFMWFFLFELSRGHLSITANRLIHDNQIDLSSRVRYGRLS
jgi:hypothetical protein